MCFSHPFLLLWYRACVSNCRFVFLLTLRRPPSSTLFPYTTLFRSLFPYTTLFHLRHLLIVVVGADNHPVRQDRKSTRLNSSHVKISYAVFCLKKKTKNKPRSSGYRAIAQYMH